MLELSAHTIGGVIAPGDTVMLIVPDTDVLTIEAKIAPQDVDQLQIGQPAARGLPPSVSARHPKSTAL